ncbi:kinesin motor domain-containing protein [Cardiosporidium cionae]|uniref:Kinesin motor domain-containing protein n=1 Tax=Cardiosporidium cionae TaxID=476202 RepID=A0ABQ7J432_9APIC|nr:kinesin motor domain-containing protein [Cardiosporidium cionae]|eukprot:KAF8817794.1 kinesin motor domain-containing protein [Cardiosporidium cionae]
MSSVKVAVRVRPFTEREIQMGTKLCIHMQDSATTITNFDDNQKTRTFSFDYSYWSHDGFEVEKNGYYSPVDAKYADQQRVFEDLGQEVITNAWEGYNAALFAYGQTGSGKSYSMIGYEPNRGIVVRVCEELFRRIADKKNEHIQYQVIVSMLEIYNEQVQDLLISPSQRVPGGLKIRRSPTCGYIVQDITKHSVDSFQAIEQKMNEGTNNRTIGATQMNATSSRAHTLLNIAFKQLIFDGATGKPVRQKTSDINLVDLAGSERTGATGATGVRLKEGCAINQSLTSLGNVISLLADKSAGKLNAQYVIPYRESALTKILENTLGGNSKTAMIAALSPAAINFTETLSTLRYADRVKQIKTYAKVNENPMEKLVRELKEEIERLKQCLGGELPQGISPLELELVTHRYESQLSESRTALEEMSKNWQDKLMATQVFPLPSNLPKIEAETNKFPSIKNINEDPFLSGKLVFTIKVGDNIVGKADASHKPDILLGGAGISTEHAKIRMESILDDETNDFEEFNFECFIEAKSKTMVNGELLEPGKTRELSHKDRILFGNHNLFVFYDPLDVDKALPDWDEAMQEASQQYLGQIGNTVESTKSHSGLQEASQSNIAKRAEPIDSEMQVKRLLQEVITRTIVLIEEVNLIAEEMDRPVVFSLKLVTRTNTLHSKWSGARISENAMQNTEILICMRRLDNGIVQFWALDLFEEKVFEIRELYSKWSNRNEDELYLIEDDPFATVADSYHLIGNAYLFLDHFRNIMPFQNDRVPILDYKGKKEGEIIMSMDVSLEPEGTDTTTARTQISADEVVHPNGDSIEDFNSVEDLLGRTVRFKLLIEEAEIYKADYSRKLQIVFKWIDGTSEFELSSSEQRNTNHKFMHINSFTVPINLETVQWFCGAIAFEVSGMAAIPALANLDTTSSLQDEIRDDMTQKLIELQNQVKQKDSMIKTLENFLAKDTLENTEAI